MSLLLPQTRPGTVRAAHAVVLHGDRYVDLTVALEGAEGAPLTGRVSAAECPDDLTPGDHVSVRFTMGVMIRVTRN